MCENFSHRRFATSDAKLSVNFRRKETVFVILDFLVCSVHSIMLGCLNHSELSVRFI